MEKIVALKNANVSDSVLIQQIEKDRISFEMNADTTLELKKAGVSNDVLSALLTATSKRSPSVDANQRQADTEAGGRLSPVSGSEGGHSLIAPERRRQTGR